jgi:AraC-like DNA-binding protein
VELCACDRPHLHLLTDPDMFSTTQRVGRMGPVTLQDVVFDADTSIDCGDVCSTYRVFLVRSGRATGKHRGLPAGGGAGSAAVYAPEGTSGLEWDAGTEILLLKMARHAVEDALGDALGRQATSQPDFAPLLPVHTAPAQSWLNMLGLFAEQFFHPDGLIHQPLVGMPFVDSLMRGFLWAAEHSHREALMGQDCSTTPRAIRTAIDVIEAEAHLPLTLSSIAARSQVSVRSLQQGFKRHLGLSPMSYLREVRLRRAHQTLLVSDPSVVTVASVAFDWGFTNLGRFAAAHAGRYNEPPAKTLRRTA